MKLIRLANKANVKTLVLNHLAPSPDNIIIKKLYEQHTLKNLKESIYLANDGDKFIVK